MLVETLAKHWRESTPLMNNVTYNLLLEREAKKRGWGDEEIARFESWRNQVAEIESNDIASRTQGDSEKGIGRGKYQYERGGESGGSGAAKTAVTRLSNYLNKNNMSLSMLPKADIKVLQSREPDFAKLSEETQDIIFLADKAEAKDVPLNKLVMGEISPQEAWLDWHWRGKAKDRPSKINLWNDRFKETITAEPVMPMNINPFQMTEGVPASPPTDPITQALQALRGLGG